MKEQRRSFTGADFSRGENHAVVHEAHLPVAVIGAEVFNHMNAAEAGIRCQGSEGGGFVEAHAVSAVAQEAAALVDDHFPGADYVRLQFPLPAHYDIFSDLMPGIGPEILFDRAPVGNVDQQPAGSGQQTMGFGDHRKIGPHVSGISQRVAQDEHVIEAFGGQSAAAGVALVEFDGVIHAFCPIGADPDQGGGKSENRAV